MRRKLERERLEKLKAEELEKHIESISIDLD